LTGASILKDTDGSISAAGSLSFTAQMVETSIPVTNVAVVDSTNPCKLLVPEENDEFVN